MVQSDIDGVPSNLKEMLAMAVQESDSVKERTQNLISLLKRCHFWPALQVKPFFSNPNLVLLHNTYKRVDVDSFQALYDECRSVILDMSAPLGKNILMHWTQGIPERLTDRQYEAMMEEGDVCEESFEGTMIHAYKYEEKWYFSTSGCPTVDSSRYHHPTKNHGVMFDECLQQMFAADVITRENGETDKDFNKRRGLILRERFTSLLHEDKTYTFLMVHHENRHIMDYTECFGDNYTVLMHLHTKDRNDPYHEYVDDRIESLEKLGVKYVQTFDSPVQALQHIRENTCSYGFIARRGDKYFKVSSNSIVEREESDLGNHNKWQNILWVWMQNKEHYLVQDYIEQYAKDIEWPKDSMGRPMDPAMLVKTVMNTMTNIVLNLYLATTRYYVNSRRFKMNRELDQELPPILRFHLAQLRHLQVTEHTHAIMDFNAVHSYFCHHQSIKNVRLLIHFFATHRGSEMNYRQAECFSVFDQQLTN